MKTPPLLLTLAAALTLSATAPAGAQPADRPKVAITILLKPDASIFVDGQRATVNQLDAALAVGATRHAVVMYFRDSTLQHPSAAVENAANAIIDKVINHHMPMCFSADAAFKACKKVGK